MIKKGISYQTNNHTHMWKNFLNQVCTLKLKIYGTSTQYETHITGIVEKLIFEYDRSYISAISIKTKFGGRRQYTMFTVRECMVLSDTESIIFKLQMEECLQNKNGLFIYAPYIPTVITRYK